MRRRWFKRTKVKIIDGDDRVNNCDIAVKPRLENMIGNGMSLWGIQIFHYAAPHYLTRWKTLPMRFLNALFNSGAVLSDSDGQLVLLGNENHELQGGSSEVLGVGLANMFMCRWFGINPNALEVINSTGKRCDFKFVSDNKTVVYEARGRANKDKIPSALKDAKEKKKHHQADEKYSVISYLPRDGSNVEIHVYDPPVDKGEFKDHPYYQLARHYEKITALAGLHILSNKISERLKIYNETGEWNNGSIELDEKLTKLGWHIMVNNESYWTNRKPIYNVNIDDEVCLHFALHTDLMEFLLAWDFEKISNFQLAETVIEKLDVSILPDGSLMTLRKGRLG